MKGLEPSPQGAVQVLDAGYGNRIVLRRSASGHDRSATKYVQVCICGDTTSNLCLLAFLEFTKCPKRPDGNSNGPTAPIWCALFVGRRARLAIVVRLKMLNLHNSEYSQLASAQNLLGEELGGTKVAMRFASARHLGRVAKASAC